MSKSFIELMDDMHLSSRDKFLDFYNAMQSNNTSLAQSILDNNPDIINQITNSENINYLIDILNARELEPKTDIDYFLNNLYEIFLKMINDTRIVGEYDSTTQYYIHNFVLYQKKYYYALKTPPIGTNPTDQEYWMEYDIKGFQGYGGITNLNYLGSWDSTVNYKPYDVVVYQNKVWYAIDNNINYTPNLNHYPWNPIMFPAQAVKTPIQKEKPLTGYSEGDFWFQITQGDEITQASWDTLRPEPLARWAASSFMIDNLIYIIGGSFGNFTSSNDVEAYDTLTNTWSTKSSYPLKLDAICAFALNGIGYCVGGQNSIDYVPTLVEKSVYSYSPSANAWTKKNDFIAPITGINAGLVANGKGCVVGDFVTPIETQGKIYLYNETNDSWDLETECPTFLVGKIVCSVDDKIYVMGGLNAAGESSKKNYIYNMTTKTWTEGLDLPNPRAYGGTFTNAGNIYLVGGMDGLLYSTGLVERYNISMNQWREEVSMSYARNSLNTENTDKYGYAIGGINLMQPMVAGYVERYTFNPEYSDFDMTIDTSLTGNNTIVIPTVSSGTYNYYVDWGDGSGSPQIMTYDDINASHTYSEAKEYKIKLYGKLNWLNFNETNIGKCLKEVTKCDLSFTNIDNMFNGCSNLEYVIENIFAKSLNITKASDVFRNCVKLSVISGDLFVNNPRITSFSGVFYGTGLITIPTDLFASNREVENFGSAFQRCEKLTTIPRNLFYNNTKATTFGSTFGSCFSLTSLPDNLFANNNAVTSYQNTFASCGNLVALPENLFGNANGSVLSYQGTFSGTGIVDIPEGIFKNAINVKSYMGVFGNTASASNPITRIPSFCFNGDNASWNLAFDTDKIEFLGRNSLNGLNLSSNNFWGSTALKTVEDDVFWAKGTASLVGDPSNLLINCSALTSLGNIDFTAIPSETDLNTIFEGCTLLKDISGFKTINNEPSLSHNISFVDCPLTHDSLVNIIDSLKTLTSATSKTLTLGADNLAKLTTVEKLVIINKYWTLPGWDIDFNSTDAADLVQYLYGNEDTNAATADTTDIMYAVRLTNINTTAVIDWYAVSRSTGMAYLYDDFLAEFEKDAKKILQPFGFAGASLRRYLLTNTGDLYHYIIDGGSITQLAKGVEDIYTQEDEDGIFAKKGTNFELLEEDSIVIYI